MRLFGSRVDDDSRGGDLDLLVESGQPIAGRQQKSLQLVARLRRRLGDQPIEVLVPDPEVRTQPVHEQARRTGIPL